MPSSFPLQAADFPVPSSRAPHPPVYITATLPFLKSKPCQHLIFNLSTPHRQSRPAKPSSILRRPSISYRKPAAVGDHPPSTSSVHHQSTPSSLPTLEASLNNPSSNQSSSHLQTSTQHQIFPSLLPLRAAPPSQSRSVTRPLITSRHQGSSSTVFPTSAVLPSFILPGHDIIADYRRPCFPSDPQPASPHHQIPPSGEPPAASHLPDPGPLLY